jgi:hypothetical protein
MELKVQVIITHMKIQSQEIIVMDLYLNYNKKVDAIDTKLIDWWIYISGF